MGKNPSTVYGTIVINGALVRVQYKSITREEVKSYFKQKANLFLYVTPRGENPENTLHLFRFQPSDFAGYNSALDFIKREFIRKCEDPDYLRFWIRLYA